MLHGQREPPQVSHMARHTHAQAAHPGCYLQRNRTGGGVDGVNFGRSIVHMATESAASKHLIRQHARFSLRHVQVSGTDRSGCGDVTQQSLSIMGPGRATGQPWAQNHPTLTGHSSLARAIDPGDLDMAERESRALPDEVLTCRWSGFHMQRERIKVRNTNSTTSANPLQVTPRMCRWCMCVSRGMGNLRWLMLVVELGHDRKLVPI